MSGERNVTSPFGAVILVFVMTASLGVFGFFLVAGARGLEENRAAQNPTAVETVAEGRETSIHITPGPGPNATVKPIDPTHGAPGSTDGETAGEPTATTSDPAASESASPASSEAEVHATESAPTQPEVPAVTPRPRAVPSIRPVPRRTLPSQAPSQIPTRVPVRPTFGTSTIHADPTHSGDAAHGLGKPTPTPRDFMLTCAEVGDNQVMATLMWTGPSKKGHLRLNVPVAERERRDNSITLLTRPLRVGTMVTCNARFGMDQDQAHVLVGYSDLDLNEFGD